MARRPDPQDGRDGRPVSHARMCLDRVGLVSPPVSHSPSRRVTTSPLLSKKNKALRISGSNLLRHLRGGTWRICKVSLLPRTVTRTLGIAPGRTPTRDLGPTSLLPKALPVHVDLHTSVPCRSLWRLLWGLSQLHDPAGGNLVVGLATYSLLLSEFLYVLIYQPNKKVKAPCEPQLQSISLPLRTA